MTDMTDELVQLIAASVARVQVMTPEERRAMYDAQLASFIRAEAGFGSDADEAEYRAAIESGDPRRIEAVKIAEAARMQQAEAYIKERGL